MLIPQTLPDYLLDGVNNHAGGDQAGDVVCGRQNLESIVIMLLLTLFYVIFHSNVIELNHQYHNGKEPIQ